VIPRHLQSDLCDAWREGGRRAFCYTEQLFESALIQRDFETARDAAWLLDLLATKTIDEVMQ
jgi:hypothetical protein